jgi:CRISPR-associated endoribonuclease Cas6
MRIKLTLRAVNEKTSIPLNYNHAVSAMIYKTVAESSPEFAEELHERGFMSENRQFKLFTFSRIETKAAFVDRSASRIVLNNPYVNLQVSSPVAEFLNNFVRGLFARQSFRIDKAEFVLADSETLDEPEFSEEMHFRALSPITEAVRNKENKIEYLTPKDDWSELITRNLRRKYEAFYGVSLRNADVELIWDKNYFADERNYKRAAKLIALPNKNNPREPIKVRGWLAPFTLRGNVALIKLGFETGFGNKNSMGFGMARVSTN